MNNKTLFTLVGVSGVAFLEMKIFIDINTSLYRDCLKNLGEFYMVQLIILALFLAFHKYLNKKTTFKKIFFSINIILLIALPIFFKLNLPNYNYIEAKEKFTKEKIRGSLRLIDKEHPPKNEMYTPILNVKGVGIENNFNPIVKAYYAFIVENDKKEIFMYSFNSFTGEIINYRKFR